MSRSVPRLQFAYDPGNACDQPSREKDARTEHEMAQESLRPAFGLFTRPQNCSGGWPSFSQAYVENRFEIHVHIWHGDGLVCAFVARRRDRRDLVAPGLDFDVGGDDARYGDVQLPMLVAVIQRREHGKRVLLRLAPSIERLQPFDVCDVAWNESAKFIEPALTTFGIAFPHGQVREDWERRASSEGFTILARELLRALADEFEDYVIEGASEIMHEIAEHEAEVRRRGLQLKRALLVVMLDLSVWLFGYELGTGTVELAQVLLRPLDLGDRPIGASHGT